MIKKNNQFFKAFKTNFSIIFWSIFIISTLFFLSKSFYEEKKVDDYLIEFKKQNQKIWQKNLQQEQDLKFFESKFYKEIYAKENLNLLNKWEKVIIFEDWDSWKKFFLEDFLKENFTDEKEITNAQKWAKLFNLY